MESSTSPYHCSPQIASKLPNTLLPEGTVAFLGHGGYLHSWGLESFSVFTIYSLRIWAADVIINTVNILNVGLLKEHYLEV